MGSRSHKTLRSTLYIAWHMHPLDLKFEVAMSMGIGAAAFRRKYIIWPFTLTCRLRSHKTLLSTLYIKWHIHLQSLKLLPLTVLEEKYPLPHVTYAPAKFEVDMYSSLGSAAFTRKYIIWTWSWGRGHKKHKSVPISLCDLCTCKFWICYVQWFWRRMMHF